MKILINEAVDKSEWNAFVHENPNGNIFQTYEFYEVYKKTKNIEPILIAIKINNKISCGLLAYISTEKSGIFTSFSRRAVIQGGPLYNKSGKVYLHRLMRKYETLVKTNVLFTQIRNLFDVSKEKEIFEDEKYIYSPHLNFLIDLTLSEEELWKQISKSKRKCINRTKDKVDILLIDSLDDVFPLLSETYNKVKLPLIDRSHFIAAKLILKDKLKIYVAKLNNKAIGCRLVLSYKNIIYDWYGGDSKKYLDYYTNDLLVWNILKENCQRDSHFFDFGGAGHPDKPYGVREFKRRFGGALVNYGRYNKINSPLKMKIAKIGFSLYKKFFIKKVRL